jgi:hypothetical protein
LTCLSELNELNQKEYKSGLGDADHELPYSKQLSAATATTSFTWFCKGV